MTRGSIGRSAVAACDPCPSVFHRGSGTGSIPEKLPARCFTYVDIAVLSKLAMGAEAASSSVLLVLMSPMEVFGRGGKNQIKFLELLIKGDSSVLTAFSQHNAPQRPIRLSDLVRSPLHSVVGFATPSLQFRTLAARTGTAVSCHKEELTSKDFNFATA
jgi:hypothetical protein